jgi:anthranilate synthase component 1
MFAQVAAELKNAPGAMVPMYRRLFADALTPVLAYRRLVRPDARMAPSFLFESVQGGERVGRFSFLGSQPIAQLIARQHEVTYRDHRNPEKSKTFHSEDPLAQMQRLTGDWTLAKLPGRAAGASGGVPSFTGGWVGFAGYDTVRYLEPEKLGFASAPPDDRGLPDLHMQLYNEVVAFDHVQKSVLAITHVKPSEYASADEAYAAGQAQLDELVERILSPTWDADPHRVEAVGGHIDLSSPPPPLPVSTMGQGGYQRAVMAVKEYIKAGDAFQIVPSQRFELSTQADPFDIYRALRVVNPSPYMFYLQVEGAMLVGSSPEILCRVENGTLINRPLAGTRRRGATPEEDAALAQELLADPKDRAEHIMLVDLGRNDVGRVAQAGTIATPDIMVVERYSHVMHISSTVTGKLAPGTTCWDALRVTLPVGTVSGAPKVRAMQIIDEVEPTRRGPYAGAVGYVDFAGNMDMAIALRTMVVLPGKTLESGVQGSGIADRKLELGTPHCEPRCWRVHIQAGGGIVADSDPDAEHQETVNKAAALAKAVDLAQRAFVPV